MMESLFWFFFGLILYVYIGYPFLLMILTRLGPAPSAPRTRITPSISLIIAAYNEEAAIARKIDNSLALDYPRSKMQIIVASDGSTDRTNEIVEGCAGRGVQLVALKTNLGKSTAQNQAVTEARGDILFFTDANVMLRSDALRKMMAYFVDEKVGCVVGKVTYLNEGETSVSRGEGVYWRYELFLRRKESELGNFAIGSGPIMAIRRSLFRPLDPDVGEDFVLPIQTAIQDGRVIYEPEAISEETLFQTTPITMFRSKVRIISKDLRGLLLCRRILNPLRHPLYAWGLVSHKLLRWLIPYFLVALLALSMVLLDRPLYRLMFLLQMILYVTAGAGYVWQRYGRSPRILAIPFSFCLVNLTALVGVAQFAAGRKTGRWRPVRRRHSAPKSRERIQMKTAIPGSRFLAFRPVVYLGAASTLLCLGGSLWAWDHPTSPLQDAGSIVGAGLLSGQVLGLIMGVRALSLDRGLMRSARSTFCLLLSLELIFGAAGAALGWVILAGFGLLAALSEIQTQRMPVASLPPLVFAASLYILTRIFEKRNFPHGNIDTPLRYLAILSLLSCAIMFAFFGASVVWAAIISVYLLPLLIALGIRIHPDRKMQTLRTRDLPTYEGVTNKVLLIALDGATWDLIDPLLADGKLPHIAQLKRDGAWGELSPINSLASPVIWTSVATGKRSSEHGIGNFLAYRIPWTSEWTSIGTLGFSTLYNALRMPSAPVNSQTKRCKALWDILSIGDKSVATVGWWATWPARPVNGTFISDQLYTRRSDTQYLDRIHSVTYPDRLLSEIRNTILLPSGIHASDIERFVSLPDRVEKSQDLRIQILRWIYSRDETFLRLAGHILDDASPDFLAVYLKGIDIASHVFWKYREPERFEEVDPGDIEAFGETIEKIYEYEDERIGQLLSKRSEDTTVILIADHGFGPSTNRRSRRTSGVHREEGAVAMAFGRNIVSDMRIEEVTALDVAPTVLALLGLPAAEDMSGRALTEVMDARFLDTYPLRRIESYEDYDFAAEDIGRSMTRDTDMEEDVRDRLRDLGYID